MQEDYLLKKIEDSHRAIAKTVSDFGAEINKANVISARIDTKLQDFIDNSNKTITDHSVRIGETEKSVARITTTARVTISVASIFIGTILVMALYITNSWRNGYEARMSLFEKQMGQFEKQMAQFQSERKENLDKIFEIFGKKNYLNQNQLESIIANVYR